MASWEKRNLRSNEAGLKYYLMGVFASALMLYGMSLLFGGLTLVLHDKTFLYWKPTVISWLFAAVVGGGAVTQRNPLRSLLGALRRGPCSTTFERRWATSRCGSPVWWPQPRCSGACTTR